MTQTTASERLTLPSGLDNAVVDQIEKMLDAGDRRNMTEGTEVIRRALAFYATKPALDDTLRRLSGLLDETASPQVPPQRPKPPAPSRPSPSTPPAPQRGSQGPTQPAQARKAGPGKPPAPSGQAHCRHSDPSKGPCQREPHEGGRHVYKGDRRLAKVENPAFSDKPPPRETHRDVDGKALRRGSVVVYIGNGSLPTGWTGKVEDFSEKHALVYGRGPKGKKGWAQESEQMLPLGELRHAG